MINSLKVSMVGDEALRLQITNELTNLRERHLMMPHAPEPTIDHKVVTRLLDRLELATDMNIDDGTAIGLGLANAANMLKDSQAESRVVILLTGVLHVFGGFQVGETHRRFMLTSILLGVFEIVLGIVLIIEPMNRSVFFYLIVSVWALLGGFILITSAIRLRRANEVLERNENA